jgi:probable F420-dependent oxidoreductase
MDFGMTIPNSGPLARREPIMTIARQGEALGFNYMAMADHLVIPKSWNSRYPYSASGTIDAFDGGDCLDPLALMAALALATEKIQLLTAVLVVPYRPPILTAKQLATIDVLSEGRVTVGCGTGWMREEFEAVGAPPFEARGKVTDEYIEAFRAMWTSDEPVYDGAYAHVDNIYFRPQPVRKPHPPIWIGGDSMPALRRAARLGDGWLPVGIAPNRPLNTVARYREAAETLAGLAREAGRDSAEIALTYWVVWYDETKRITLEDGSRHIFTGEPGEIAEDINALGEIGVSAVLFNFVSDTLENTLAGTERFTQKVMPLVGT